MGLLRRLGFGSFAFWFGSLGGLVAGAGAMLVLFPFLFPPPELNEEPPAAGVLADQTTGRTRIAFEFDRNAPGRDLIHWANGTGALIKTQQGWVLRFDQEFEAGPGPNYWIYFNKRAVGDEDDFNADAARVKMSQLRSFRGGQNYSVPAAIDPDAFHTVTIWCESFGVYIGSAALAKGT
jgi:hypothetical protein